MHARAEFHHSVLHDYRIGKFAHARRAKDENGGDAVLDADLGVALIGHLAVRARQQERVSRHRDGSNIRGDKRIFAAQLEAGIEHRVEDDAARIRLVGILGDFPALAQTGEKRIPPELIARRMRPALRPLDRAWGCDAAEFCKQSRQETVARAVADAGILSTGCEIFRNGSRQFRWRARWPQRRDR